MTRRSLDWRSPDSAEISFGFGFHVNKKPGGLFTVRLALIHVLLIPRRTYGLLVAGRARRRMDLMITIMHRTTILDVSRDTIHRRIRQ